MNELVEPARPAEHQVVLEPGGEFEVHFDGHVAGEVIRASRRSRSRWTLGASDVDRVESLSPNAAGATLRVLSLRLTI